MVKRFFWVACFLVLYLAIALGGWISPAYALTQEQKLYNEVWRIVNRSYLDETFNHQNWWFVRQKALKKPLRTREQTYAAIDQMLKTLGDPFTRFLPPQSYRSLQVTTSGELSGVGLQIALDPQTGLLTVIAPIAGSPAEMAGLQPRDRIMAIDGIPTRELTIEEAASRMRGPTGTVVTLTIERDRQEQESVEITRDHITLNPVIADLRSIDSKSGSIPIGYLRLTQFNAYASQELGQAIARLEEQGAAGYILDLRNNPGGLLTAGIEIARQWIDRGTIVYVVNRQGVLESFDATGSALTDDPLVVLVNHGSASASEILAGALQDNDRAQLLGETTFGKGLIQSLFDLSDGSGLAVTIAKYETPDHHDINQLGIEPDRVVPAESISRNQIATASDAQYEAALELLAEQTQS
ncbi:S41 family peptidase [Roseofilum sp. BLCC_M91]|uniref:S41 family peptidase n=1 Tax=Roseofilum halophilum BLCC-M91 TaxID=3022259 RepID=A0ABT7BHF7_9CYAN|nr:carboxyl-terminal processing protease CtpA [Roseofilum halophilum]MDJ1178619.1 S41 family peptidase [Roseofilum halophilum BLCC-M91]